MTKEGRYEKTDLMPFGKYKGLGRTVFDVIVTDIRYITWAIENIEWFVLSNEAYESYEKFLPEKTWV